VTLIIVTLSGLAPWIEEISRRGVAKAFVLESRNNWTHTSEQKKDLFQAQWAQRGS